MFGMEFLSNCRLRLEQGKLFVGRSHLPLLERNGAEMCHRVVVVNHMEVFPHSSTVVDGESEQVSSCTSCQVEQSKVHDIPDDTVEALGFHPEDAQGNFVEVEVRQAEQLEEAELLRLLYTIICYYIYIIATTKHDYMLL